MTALPRYNRTPPRDALRHSANLARAHVGAAGFQQSDALEHLIRLGSLQSEVSDALEDLLDAAQAEIAASDGDDRALAELIRFGYAQLEAADRQRNLVNIALAEIGAVPLRDLSLGHIERLSAPALASSAEGGRTQRALWQEVAARAEALNLPGLRACLDAYRAALLAQAQASTSG